MLARLGPAQPAQGADVIARAVGALALAALAVIHVVDLPGTLGPTPLVGVGYLGIIAAAVVTGGVMITRSHWLAWAAAGGVAASAMGGYLLTRAVPGGFLGDHADVGNWRCPLGLPRSAWRRFSSCSSYSPPGRRERKPGAWHRGPCLTARPRTPEFSQRHPG